MTNIFRSFFGLSLSIQMIIATLLAIFVGLFFGESCKVFASWSSSYILILKITTIPYLVCAILHGIGKLYKPVAKEILQKGILFIGAVWIINILMIYLAVFLFPQAKGTTYASYASTPAGNLNFSELLIPDNIFYALSNNIVPAVVVFVVLLGIALIQVKEKQALMGFLETLVDSFTRITGWIAAITPIGTFLIIANQVGTVQFSIMKQMSTYLIIYIFTTLTLVFWIFPRLVGMFTTFSAGRWIRALFPVLILAYTTNVVIVTLPFIIELIKKEIETAYHKEGKIQDQIQGIVSVVFNLPLGSLFLAVFVFFIAAFYHLPLSGGSQLQLFLTTFFTSLGAVGLGSWINSLNFLLENLGLPSQAVDLYLATVPFTAGFQSMVSVMEISSLSLVITLACHSLLSFQWRSLFKRLIVMAVPLFLLISGFKVLAPLPKIENPYISISEIELKAPISIKVYKEGDLLPPPREGDTFERILQTRTLRVGYNPEAIPFCFNNTLNHLAGFDVAFAYELAADLGCSLEFVPLHFGKIGEELNNNLYDIGMSGLSLTEERLKTVCFTTPYQNSKLVFVMLKKYSKKFTSLNSILEDPFTKVCVVEGTSYAEVAKKLFPAEQIVLLDKYDDFVQYAKEALLLRGEPQAISWSLKHPQFAVVSPTPSLGQESLSYALAPHSERLLCFMNMWIRLKKNEKFTQTQYDLWVLGKTESTRPQEPRWSILRNVLKWGTTD